MIYLLMQVVHGLADIMVKSKMIRNLQSSKYKKQFHLLIKLLIALPVLLIVAMLLLDESLVGLVLLSLPLSILGMVMDITVTRLSREEFSQK